MLLLSHYCLTMIFTQQVLATNYLLSTYFHNKIYNNYEQVSLIKFLLLVLDTQLSKNEDCSCSIYWGLLYFLRSILCNQKSRA